MPAPWRGELVRLLGEELRANEDALGRLVSLKVGKAPSKGLGKVKEMIDVCDFEVACRDSSTASSFPERPNHKLAEQWHLVGVVGIITAYNFPVAV